MESATSSDDRSAHRRFLNRYYGISRHFYDVTRKYYLFGRDTCIRELLREPWSSLVEVGPGTGRNLRKLRQKRPLAKLGGIEASDQMLGHARRKCPWAELEHGFAEDCDYKSLFGEPPERILFSYCLSMVTDPLAALDNARRAISDDGEVVVVDFADLSSLPGPARRGLRRWLETFHVEPLDETLLTRHDARISYGPGRYFLIGRMGPLRDEKSED